MLKTIYHNSRNDAREAVKNGWGDKVIDNGADSENGKRWATVIEIDEPGTHTISLKDVHRFIRDVRNGAQNLSSNARILVSRNKREGKWKVRRRNRYARNVEFALKTLKSIKF